VPHDRDVELDHALIAVADLAAAARELEARHGLTSVEGGRHPGYGTANRIVPLGDSYLELVTVADESEAARSPFGSWVARVQSVRGRPLGWAVRTHGLDAVARRLELTIRVGSRTTRSGAVLRWRLAGLERAAAEPSLPIVIEWAQGVPFRVASRRATPLAPFGSQSCSSPATATASPIGWVPIGCRSPSARDRRRS
jgi:Glyoxalase-like domain